MIDSYQGVGGGTGGGYYLRVCFFLLALLFFVLSCPISFFKSLEYDSCCVCFRVYYLFSFPLTRSYWVIEIVVSVM